MLLQATTLLPFSTDQYSIEQRPRPSIRSWLRAVVWPRPRAHSDAQSLAAVLSAWLAANYWSQAQLIALAQACCGGRAFLTPHELDALMCGKSIHLSPRFFKALAGVHEAVRAHQRAGADAAFPVHELLQYSVPLVDDEQGDRASWWFALSIGEAWAFEALQLSPSFGLPDDVQGRVAAYLRRLMVDQGLDPVADGLELFKPLFGDNRPVLQRYSLWLLSLGRLEAEELYASLRPLLTMARRCGGSEEGVDGLLGVI